MLTRPCVRLSVGYKPLQVGLKEMNQTSQHIFPRPCDKMKESPGFSPCGLLMFENKVVY